GGCGFCASGSACRPRSPTRPRTKSRKSMSDYLYDGKGPPDPEVARLEELLAPMRYRGAAPRPRARRWPLYAPAAAPAARAAPAPIVLPPRVQPGAVRDGAGPPP